MKIVLQRVSNGSVKVDQKIVGNINKGYVLLVGISPTDTSQIVERMADKVINLRINEDENGKMNKNLVDINGSILSISQFTLYANCRKGRRPSFDEAAKPEYAKKLYEEFNTFLSEKGIHVETGIFQSDMKVELINDGPVTIILDSNELF